MGQEVKKTGIATKARRTTRKAAKAGKEDKVRLNARPSQAV